MKKRLWFGSKKGFYGYLGDSTSHPDFKVGDVIVYNNTFNGGCLVKAIIVRDKKGTDFPMGLGGITIKNLLNKTEVVKVLSFEYLTDQVCEGINAVLKVEEVEAEELTLAEIEEKLGYKIKIVG
jgi:hypothetical protein